MGDMEADAEADAGAVGHHRSDGKKYGLASDNMANIRTALENDDMFWEEAAADQGMAVDSYKKMMKLEVETNHSGKPRKRQSAKTSGMQYFRNGTGKRKN